MSVSVPSTLLLLLAFMASSPSTVSLSRKVRVWCPIHLDTQGTQNGDRQNRPPRYDGRADAPEVLLYKDQASNSQSAQSTLCGHGKAAPLLGQPLGPQMRDPPAQPLQPLLL